MRTFRYVLRLMKPDWAYLCVAYTGLIVDPAQLPQEASAGGGPQQLRPAQLPQVSGSIVRPLPVRHSRVRWLSPPSSDDRDRSDASEFT